MKQTFFYLTIILFANCNMALTESTNSDCSNAIVDEKMVMLSNYNKKFYDENYTGTVMSHFDEEKTRIEWSLHYENGEITKYESFYENGVTKLVKPIKCNSIHGNMVYFKEAGIKSNELEYRYGRKHGVGRSYYETGTVQKEIHFKNDLQDGEQYGFSRDGDTTLIEHYVDGKKIK